MRVFVVFVVLSIIGTGGGFSFVASANQALQVHDGPQLVEAAGYTLNLVVTKGDSALPTIILESGGGADSRQWAALQPQLAAQTRATVVSYDRPGLGLSPLPTKPFNIVEEADALRQAINSIGLGQRVILVGSSYGGLLIQLWASRAPNSVQGLLFLDPNSPAAALSIRAFTNERPLSDPKTPQQRAMARIEAAGDARFTAVYAHPLPIEVPVIVLSAEKPLFTDTQAAEVFRLSHELLAASVRKGKRIIAERSAHNIAGDRPDLVITSVKELMAAPSPAK
jgi:pimeloyl-ACP methyl ester carboxylesterase